MIKVTVIATPDYKEQFINIKNGGINLFERELYDRGKISFVSVEDIEKSGITACDVLIIEDEISNFLTYIKILDNAPEVQNIVVTTKPGSTISVLNYLMQKSILEKVSAIFLDFDLAEDRANPEKNEENALAVYNFLDENFFDHGSYGARIIGITAYEDKDDKYLDLKRSMRLNGDFVLNKAILRDETSKLDFITFLKSVPGIFWKDDQVRQLVKPNAFDKNLALKYEKANKKPEKDLDFALKFLRNIESVMPEIGTGKYEISKYPIKIAIPNETGYYTKYTAVINALNNKCEPLSWVLNHPLRSKEFPKTKYQYKEFGVFTAQIDKAKLTKIDFDKDY